MSNSDSMQQTTPLTDRASSPLDEIFNALEGICNSRLTEWSQKAATATIMNGGLIQARRAEALEIGDAIRSLRKEFTDLTERFNFEWAKRKEAEQEVERLRSSDASKERDEFFYLRGLEDALNVVESYSDNVYNTTVDVARTIRALISQHSPEVKINEGSQ